MQLYAIIYFISFIDESCTVSTIFGYINHNREKGNTVLTFEADNTNATYSCKLDKQVYRPCKLKLLQDFNKPQKFSWLMFFNIQNF